MSGSSQSKLISRVLQWVSSAALLLLAVILIIFLIKETIVLATLLFAVSNSTSIYSLIDGLIIYLVVYSI